MNPRETFWRTRIDARRAVAYQQRGGRDPSMIVTRDTVWRAARTPEGISTLALRFESDGVRAAAWGPGAEWAIDQLPRLCGGDDNLDGFDASLHPLISEAHHRFPRLRLGATDLVFDALVSSIVEQKITGMQAFGAWRNLLTWQGDRAPGPTPKPMFAPPSIEGWGQIPSWVWHRAGLEPPQARTIVEAARRGNSLVRALDTADRELTLTSFRGVGVWTAAETRIRAYGDPDAVSFKDFHLSHEVGYALTGTRVDDNTMAELLAPWAGHRQRVIRLIAASGVHEPRRGARLHPEDHRSR